MALFLTLGAVPVWAAILNVNINDPTCNDSTGIPCYCHIQPAVDDAAIDGDTVSVAAGTYDEQVIIDKSLTLQGAGATTIIQPSQATANGFLLFNRVADGANNTAGIIVAKDVPAPSVTIKDLKVDGSLITAGAGGADVLVGVFYRAAEGIIDNVIVTMTPIDSTPDSGGMWLCPIDQTVTVEVKNCNVSTYCRNGITANEQGLTANIHHNTINGSGLTGDIPQNGIQIGFGASGRVNNNDVDNHAYNGTDWTATGILFSDVPAGSGSADGNTLRDNQIGLVAERKEPGSSKVTFYGNTVNAPGLTGLPEDIVGIHLVTYNADASLEADIARNQLTNGEDEGICVGTRTEHSPAGNIAATIANNTISNWAHGIILKSSVDSAYIRRNYIQNNPGDGSGIHVTANVDASKVHVNFNNITGNTVFGVYNHLNNDVLDAEYNWWGNASGPSGEGSGTGDAVSTQVDYEPWLKSERKGALPSWLLPLIL